QERNGKEGSGGEGGGGEERDTDYVTAGRRGPPPGLDTGPQGERYGQRSVRRRGAARVLGHALLGLVLRVNALVLTRRPLHRVLDGRAAGDPREHVGDDEGGLHLLRRRRDRPREPEEGVDRQLILEHGELLVVPEAGHGLLVVVLQERHVVATARGHRRLELVVEGEEVLLGPGRVLAELPDGVDVRVRDVVAKPRRAEGLGEHERVLEDAGIGVLRRPE